MWTTRTWSHLNKGGGECWRQLRSVPPLGGNRPCTECKGFVYQHLKNHATFSPSSKCSKGIGSETSRDGSTRALVHITVWKDRRLDDVINELDDMWLCQGWAHLWVESTGPRSLSYTAQIQPNEGQAGAGAGAGAGAWLVWPSPWASPKWIYILSGRMLQKFLVRLSKKMHDLCWAHVNTC